MARNNGNSPNATPLCFRNCWQNYVDFYRCENLKGEGYQPCAIFKRAFQAYCPNEWVEKWDGQRDEGVFPAKL